MKKNEKVRIEIRFDEIKDKDLIDFIDNNGSTRAGFIKQVLKTYKNQMEIMIPNTIDSSKIIKGDEQANKSTQKKKKKLSKINDTSFSTKDFD